MKYLLDTNVLSELQKPLANPNVSAYIGRLPQESLYTCSFVLGEICHGVERLEPGRKRTELFLWLNNTLPWWFEDRVIPLDTEVMLEWGRMTAAAGRHLPLGDSLIAAAALNRRLCLLTRNVRDFSGIEGLLLDNPWASP